MPSPGITPAYAGKSALQLCTDSCSRDHPRVCGEKSVLLFCIPSRLGSPPRMRGKAGNSACGNVKVGITPAYAGKSHFATSFRLSRRDHPRVCGEKPLPSGRTPLL